VSYVLNLIKHKIEHDLCMKALSNSRITAYVGPKSGVGIKICPSTNRIPCLLFVDDCTLLYKADQTNYRKLRKILDKFCTFLGWLVNYHKFVLTFSKNATILHRQLVAGIFNINHSNSLGKYCPVFQKQPISTTFKDIIKKAMNLRVGRRTICQKEVGSC